MLYSMGSGLNNSLMRVSEIICSVRQFFSVGLMYWLGIYMLLTSCLRLSGLLQQYNLPVIYLFKAKPKHMIDA